MPYSGSGVFAVANSFTPNTTISSSLMNATLADIANGLSNALTKDNQSAMAAPLRLADGSVTLPALQFGADTNTGLRRSAADEMRWVTGGQDRMYIDADGKAHFLGDVRIVGDLDAAGLGGSLPIAGGTMTGPLLIDADEAATALAARGLSFTAGLVVYNGASPTPGAALMSFHRPDAYAVLFGLDTDNLLKVGGASMGAVAYKIFHEGQPPAIANVPGLQTAIDGKAAVSHAHTIAQITSLQATLDAKAGVEDSTSASETAYDLGSIVLAVAATTTYARATHQNQVIAVYAGSGTTGPNINGTGPVLTGTWRCRGGFNSFSPPETEYHLFLMQRVL